MESYESTNSNHVGRELLGTVGIHPDVPLCFNSLHTWDYGSLNFSPHI